MPPPTIPDDVLAHPLLTTTGLLVEAHAGLADAFGHHLARHGAVTGQTFEILLRLVRSPGQQLRMSELAAQTTLSASGLTRAVDRLEREDLVHRVACAEDRRVSFATLTPAGEAAIAHALPIHVAQVDEVLGGALTAEELTDLERLLRRLRDAVNPHAARASDGVGAPPG